MTPELAKDIYYEYYGSALRNRGRWDKPTVQHECEMEAWAAVIDHIENDSLMDVPEVKAAWDKYQEAKRDLDKPWTVGQAWDEFLAKYEKAREERQ